MKTNYPVRDAGDSLHLWGGFRDELVATGMTLSLLIVGSFVLADKLLFSETNKVDPNAAVIEYNPETLGVSDATPTRIDLVPKESATRAAMTTVLASDSAQATEGAYVVSEVPFGEDGEYDFSSYKIKFIQPKLIFDARTNARRKLIIQVELTNKTVMEGMDARLTASIVKDGIVIVPSAALYIPNRQIVGPNQEMVFQAELNLVEATDVREIRYDPGGDLPVASHFLYQ